MRTDSLATIETEGLVGGNYLGITTGSDTAPIVAANATIAGKEPLDIAELVQQMGDTVTKVNDVVDDMRDDVQRAVVAIADTAENANVLITGVTGEVTKIAASGAMITADAAQIADGIRSGKGTSANSSTTTSCTTASAQSQSRRKKPPPTRSSWSRVRKRPSRACSRRTVLSRG